MSVESWFNFKTVKHCIDPERTTPATFIQNQSLSVRGRQLELCPSLKDIETHEIGEHVCVEVWGPKRKTKPNDISLYFPKSPLNTMLHNVNSCTMSTLTSFSNACTVNNVMMCMIEACRSNYRLVN